MKTNLFKYKQTTNKFDKIAFLLTLFFAILFIVLFLSVISFIIYGSIDGWKTYGLKGIFGTVNYNLERKQAGVWLPLVVTLLVSGLSILIAGPIGVKTAIFLKFRIPPGIKKYAKCFIEILADIPSVLFGLFAISALGPLIKKIFNLPTSYNLLSCAIMLTFMIVPTVISLTSSALDSVDRNFLISPILLGNNKTQAIYKVYKKSIRSKIIISLVVAASRAIGETMAVSMILQSQNYNQIFNSGFLAVWRSYLQTLGVLISGNMFAELSPPSLQGLLFSYALVLLVAIIILNGFIKFAFQKSRGHKYNLFLNNIKKVFLFVPNKIKYFFTSVFYVNNKKIKLTEENYSQLLSLYFNKKAFIVNKNNNIYTIWKLIWELICASIVFSFILWIIFNFVTNGIIGICASSQSIFKLGENTTGQAIINTFILIIISIGISFIISMSVAIFINEFMPDGKLKSAFLFFIDSLGATPSIIYGMFGLVFFLQTLGLSFAGHSGKSLMAGCLTIVFVILPSFTRTIIQALQTVSLKVRQASYTLGVSKLKTIFTIILPTTIQHILTSIILSIGRVLAETAPLYLTAGIGSTSKICLMSNGQTLTTRIYAQISSNNLVTAKNIMYECALILLILIIIILILVNIVIPKIFNKKPTSSIKKINIKNNYYKHKQFASRLHKMYAYVVNLERRLYV